MTIADLRAEHAVLRIGPIWLAAVGDIARRLVQNYPPEIYGDGVSWDSALEDLVQDVVTGRLLAESQAEYLMDVCETRADFERLLARQIRLTLARRRRRTVVDQLLGRARRILSAAPFEAIAGPPESWRLAGTMRDQRAPSGREIRLACDRARLIPVVPASGTERAGAIYRTSDLELLLRVVAETLPTLIRVRDLDEIFRNVLTPMLPSSLDPGASPGRDAPAISPEDAYAVKAAVESLLAELTDGQRELIAAKLAGVSDTDLAVSLGVSRPTAAKHKTEAMRIVSAHLGDLSEAQSRSALEILAGHIAERWPG